MGNILRRCSKEEEEDDHHHHHHNNSSRSADAPPSYQYQHRRDDEPAPAVPPRPRYCYQYNLFDDLTLPAPPASPPAQSRGHGVAGLLYFQAASSMVVTRTQEHLRCCSEEEDADDDHAPTSSPSEPDEPAAALTAPPASRPPDRRLPRPRHGFAALKHDLLHFQATSTVPRGLGGYVTARRQSQVKWYKNMLEAYNNAKPRPKTSADASKLVANALWRIQRANMEAVLAFYGFKISAAPVLTSKHHLSLPPDRVQFVLKTLPVDAKCIGDGDGFTAYVDKANTRESAKEAFMVMAQAHKCGHNQNEKTLRKKLRKAGISLEDEILAKQYKFRLRGVDAPEIGMKYGKESQDALVKLIAGKSVVVRVYGQDQYKRYVGDIYCNGVFIQKQMLKKGHVWHYKAYDARPKFAKWEKGAQGARRGLWAADNPEKPWEWRKKNPRHKKVRQTIWRHKPHVVSSGIIPKSHSSF